MRKEKFITTNDLLEGMVLSRDVELNHCLVLAANTQLSQRLIHYLAVREITAIWVYDEPVESIHAKAYLENVEHFHNVAKLVQSGEPVRQEDVKSIIGSYLNIPTRHALFRFTNGIRQVDQYTYEHSLSVCYLAILLGRWLKLAELDRLAETALLHDLGKIKVANKILNKPGPLNDDEWKQMKMHSVYGYEFLRENSDFSLEVSQAVLYHHEKMNGTGYPQGLQGRMIPEMARVIAICDVFDALTSNRIYRKKMDMFEVLEYMYTQYQSFDPEYLRVFVENMMDYLIGEQVLLSNGQVGKIIFKNPQNPFDILVQTDKDFVALGKSNLKVAQML